MKKIKMIMWAIIVVFVVLVLFQNKAFFSLKQAFTLNLYYTQAYESPELPNGVWFLAASCFGFIIAYFFGLIERFRANSAMKKMKVQLDSQSETIGRLQSELDARSGLVSKPATVGLNTFPEPSAANASSGA